MASHERCQIELELTPARKRIIKLFRLRHKLTSRKITDAETVAFMAELGFMVPEHLSRACDYMVGYRKAEGCDDMDQITATVALSWGKVRL